MADKELIPTYEELEPNMARAMEVITPKKGDPTYSVLRTHLLYEELLRDFIASRFAHPESLNGARLTFVQVLAIAKASATTLEPTDWRWEAVDQLNKLRNLLSHNIDAVTVIDRINLLKKLISTSINVPLPIKENTASKSSPGDDRRYSSLDMLLMALFGVLSVRLGFDTRLRLLSEDKRNANIAREAK